MVRVLLLLKPKKAGCILHTESGDVLPVYGMYCTCFLLTFLNLRKSLKNPEDIFLLLKVRNVSVMFQMLYSATDGLHAKMVLSLYITVPQTLGCMWQLQRSTGC